MTYVRKSPAAADRALQRLEISRSFDGEKNFNIKYNFALRNLEEREKWFKFITSNFNHVTITFRLGCKTLHSSNYGFGERIYPQVCFLPCSETYLRFRNRSIQSMMKAFWDNCIGRIVVFEMLIFITMLFSSSILLSLGLEDEWVKKLHKF